MKKIISLIIFASISYGFANCPVAQQQVAQQQAGQAQEASEYKNENPSSCSHCPASSQPMVHQQTQPLMRPHLASHHELINTMRRLKSLWFTVVEGMEQLEYAIPMIDNEVRNLHSYKNLPKIDKELKAKKEALWNVFKKHILEAKFDFKELRKLVRQGQKAYDKAVDRSHLGGGQQMRHMGDRYMSQPYMAYPMNYDMEYPMAYPMNYEVIY